MNKLNNVFTLPNVSEIVKGISNRFQVLSLEDELRSRYVGKRVDLETAMAVISNGKVVPGASDKYVQVQTITTLKKLVSAGMDFEWDIDMLEAPCFKDLPKDIVDFDEEEYKFAGKHRVVVYPIVDGELVKALKKKLSLAFYIYNSSDRSMSFAVFVGWLVWLCMNGCFGGEALKTADGEDAFIKQRHSYFTPEELNEKLDNIVAAFVDYIDNKKYEEMLSRLHTLTTIHDGEDKSIEFMIAKQAMQFRIAQQSWYTKKFLEKGNSILITDEQVKNFMDEVTRTARTGQLGTDVHDIMQRYQGAIGANPQAESRVAHIPTRLEYKLVTIDEVSGKKEYKDSKLTKLQLRDQNAIQKVNSDLTNFVFDNFAKAA